MEMSHHLGALTRMETVVLVLTSKLMVAALFVEVRNLILGLHHMVKVTGSSVNNFGLNVGMRGSFLIAFP